LKKKHLILFLFFAVFLLITDACGNTSELHTVSKYKLEGIGNPNIGPGVIGEIGGENYLFLAKTAESSGVGQTSGDSGIMILSLQNPNIPKEVSFLKVPETNMYVEGLQLYGTVLYASTPSALWVIDISIPSVPRQISILSTVNPVSTAIMSNYAYINNAEQEISILDISNPVNPGIVGNFSDLPVNDLPGHLIASGTLLFSLNSPRLDIIDISSPLSPKEVGYFLNAGHDITEGNFELQSGFLDLAIADKYAYIASGIDGMRVLDISNPSAPQEIAHLKLQGNKVAWRIFISGHLAYLIVGSSVDVIDISNPHNPKLQASASFPSSNNGPDFTMSGDYIYAFVSNPENIGPPAIEIMNIPR